MRRFILLLCACAWIQSSFAATTARHRVVSLLPVADLTAPAQVVFDNDNLPEYTVPDNPGSFRFVVVESISGAPHRDYLPLAAHAIAGDIIVIDNRTYSDVWITDLNQYTSVSPSGPVTWTVTARAVLRFYFDGSSWRQW
jgi:hypothetical protein